MIVVDDNAIKIEDSWNISKKKFDTILNTIREENPDNIVMKERKNKSLKLEWAAHNGLYNLGMFRSHTKDVDFEYPQKWYMKVVYALLGGFFWIFLK